MLFRNSIRLLMENFKGVYKILLYKFIVGFIAVALCSAMILPEAIEIWNSAPMREIVDGIKDFAHAFVSADETELSLIKDSLFGTDGAVRALVDFVVSKLAGIVFTAVGCLLVYLLARFADTLCYFTMGSLLNDKMSTYAETPFHSAYVTNLGKASIYALAYVPVAFAIDLVCLSLCLGILATVPIFAALFLTMTVIVAEQALKLTFTGRWMPAMVADGKRLRDAVKRADKTEKRMTMKMFSNYLVIVYLIVIINAVAAICTFGSALLISVPTSFMLLICQQYVNYYTVCGKKYFITYDAIATNLDRGDSEHFFDYIDKEK